MGIEQVAKPSTNQETADSSLTNHRTVSGQLDLWWGVGGGKGKGGQCNDENNSELRSITAKLGVLGNPELQSKLPVCVRTKQDLLQNC